MAEPYGDEVQPVADSAPFSNFIDPCPVYGRDDFDCVGVSVVRRMVPGPR